MRGGCLMSSSGRELETVPVSRMAADFAFMCDLWG